MKKHFTAGIIGLITLLSVGTTGTQILQESPAYGAASQIDAGIVAAPIALAGDNVYIAWPTNETGNNEVMFRASTDGGATFTDKINLSNTTESNSTRVEIDSDADSVVVTWWETNQTDDTPVMRVSDDNGATFGPVLKLAANGTIGQVEDEGQ